MERKRQPIMASSSEAKDAVMTEWIVVMNQFLTLVLRGPVNAEVFQSVLQFIQTTLPQRVQFHWEAAMKTYPFTVTEAAHPSSRQQWCKNVLGEFEKQYVGTPPQSTEDQGVMNGVNTVKFIPSEGAWSALGTPANYRLGVNRTHSRALQQLAKSAQQYRRSYRA